MVTLVNNLDKDKEDRLLEPGSAETNHIVERSSIKSSHIEKETLTPVKTYEITSVNRKDILEENKNKSGIYRFYNKLNGKFYIGSSKNLKNRFLKYFNLNNISKIKNNLTISRALVKYGYNNFRLEILEYCDSGYALKSILLEARSERTILF